jgi:hypothetical protein
MHPRTKTRTNKQTNTHINLQFMYANYAPINIILFILFIIIKNIDFFFLPQSLTHSLTHTHTVII